MFMANEVTLSEVTPEIALITLKDVKHKNTFTKELIEGLLYAFAQIKVNTQYKVVILTGYESYFASGGTQESLMAIYNKELQFNAVNIYSLALDCELPVISAMQGHGIGGGFVFGLFSDFIVLSKESIYTCNFMKYGFTPGMGATYIVPKKLGVSLGHEMLLLGRTYRGIELEQRGIPFTVVRRADVMDKAMELAEELAEKPRCSLITLKAHLVSGMRNELDGFIEKELKMHDETFHQEEVKEKIATLFGQ